MRILKGDHVCSKATSKCIRGLLYAVKNVTEAMYLLKGVSDIRSFPPLMLSARNTLPVVAIATMCECSLKGLNEIGS